MRLPFSKRERLKRILDEWAGELVDTATETATEGNPGCYSTGGEAIERVIDDIEREILS